jgi:hypothetical protein
VTLSAEGREVARNLEAAGADKSEGEHR